MYLGFVFLNVDVLQLAIQVVKFHYLTHKEIAVAM